MRIAIHDSERETLKHKTFPNYALMKISAYHKSLGDTVEWFVPTEKYDKVYSSKVFDFTPENPYLPPDTIKGGTGYDVKSTLPSEIENCYPDYSIYPECDYAIGYITRGCPNHCRWCVVPEKEGNIQPYRTWQQLVRPDTDKLVLMDNNILACDYGINQLESLIDSGYRIDLNQGMDARLVTDNIARILSKLKWIRYIRFSCDSTPQIKAIFRTAELLQKYGVKPYKLFVYLLVTDDLENAAHRVDELKKLKGINIYAQAERNFSKGIVPNKQQLEFAQRYVYSGKYRSETWQEYCDRKSLSGALTIKPITLKAANDFVKQYHRHNLPTVGCKFAIACYNGDQLCGVAICGRPTARNADDGKTIEIYRNCTDGTYNACSKLYGACVKVAKDMGYERVITYILDSENGASVLASNFTFDGRAGLPEQTGSRQKSRAVAPKEYKKRYVYNIINSKEDKQMAKKRSFETAILKDIKSVAGDSFADNIKMLPLNQLHDNPENFYDLSDLETLVEDIDRQGLKTPLYVVPDDENNYTVISGHRRKAAVQELIDSGKYGTDKLPCYIGAKKSEAETMLDLIMLNATTRVISDAETVKQCEKLEEVFRQLEANGKKVQGRMRDKIAAALNVSPAQVGKVENIRHYAIDEVKSAIDEGKMSISTANEVVKLEPEKQKELIEKKNPEEITHKEVKKATSVKNKKKEDEQNYEDITLGEYDKNEVFKPSATEVIEISDSDLEKAKAMAELWKKPSEYFNEIVDSGMCNGIITGYIMLVLEKSNIDCPENILQIINSVFDTYNAQEARERMINPI